MTPPLHTRRSLLLGSALALAGCGAKSVATSASPSTNPSGTGPSGTASPAPSPSATPSWQLPGDDIVTGPARASAVALTFHGQGDPAIARAILALMAARGAHVTVMCVGTWAQQYPAVVREILAGGHDLGNHTYDHPADLTSMDEAAVRSEIRRGTQAVQQAAGQRPRWFRPSATQRSTPTIRAAARAEGYPRCVSFDVDPRDFLEPGAATVVARTKAAVRPGSIVSLHFGHRGTLQALPQVLDDLAARHLRPVTLTELLG